RDRNSVRAMSGLLAPLAMRFAISRSRSLRTDRSPVGLARGPRRHVRMPSWRRSWSICARSVVAPVASATAEACHRVVSASGASRLRDIRATGGDSSAHLVGARSSSEPRVPARDGLMEGDAMMRIPFALAHGHKAGECRAVVAGGDRGDQPPHPREHGWPRRLADAFRERLAFFAHLLGLDEV